MNDAKQLFWEAIDWLRESYFEHRFFAERDIVWTVQKRLIDEISRKDLPYRVFHNYTIELKNENIYADLVLIRPKETVEVAAEFKYEPAHRRSKIDIPPGKFNVVRWPEVEKDVVRIKDCVNEKRVQYACSLLIDEGGHFKKNEPPLGGRWERWSSEIHVLISEAKNHSINSN